MKILKGLAGILLILLAVEGRAQSDGEKDKESETETVQDGENDGENLSATEDESEADVTICYNQDTEQFFCYKEGEELQIPDATKGIQIPVLTRENTEILSEESTEEITTHIKTIDTEINAPEEIPEDTAVKIEMERPIPTLQMEEEFGLTGSAPPVQPEYGEGSW
ncbi:MAG: hypothetical protein ACK40G_11735 [Cytophagaceae bacterium]